MQYNVSNTDRHHSYEISDNSAAKMETGNNRSEV